MARTRDKHLLPQLAALPWWVSLVVAVVVYVTIWILPTVAGSNAVLQPLGEALSDKAWWFAVPFVVVAGISAFNASHRRRLLDDQTGIQSLRSLSWQDFERLVGEAYRRQGYAVEEIGGSAPDGGVDLVLHRQGSKVVVQCKRWRYAQVGVGRIREFYGVTVAEKAERGIVVTTGTFPPDAVAFARGKPLELVDGERLEELVAGVQPENPVGAVPICPKCGGETVQRVARRGRQRRESILGLSPVSELHRGAQAV